MANIIPSLTSNRKSEFEHFFPMEVHGWVMDDVLDVYLWMDSQLQMMH